jgi:hypothetical protein
MTKQTKERCLVWKIEGCLLLPALLVTYFTFQRITIHYTDKKENQILLKYKENQSGAVAKSYMTNGLLIYGEIFAHFLIY